MIAPNIVTPAADTPPNPIRPDSACRHTTRSAFSAIPAENKRLINALNATTMYPSPKNPSPGIAGIPARNNGRLIVEIIVFTIANSPADPL
jgi:hypothetical protein